MAESIANFMGKYVSVEEGFAFLGLRHIVHAQTIATSGSTYLSAGQSGFFDAFSSHISSSVWQTASLILIETVQLTNCYIYGADQSYSNSRPSNLIANTQDGKYFCRMHSQMQYGVGNYPGTKQGATFAWSYRVIIDMWSI